MYFLILKKSLNRQINTIKWILQLKPPQKEVLHNYQIMMFVDICICYKHYFQEFDLKLTLWPWRSPEITDIIP